MLCVRWCIGDIQQRTPSSCSEEENNSLRCIRALRALRASRALRALRAFRALRALRAPLCVCIHWKTCTSFPLLLCVFFCVVLVPSLCTKHSLYGPLYLLLTTDTTMYAPLPIYPLPLSCYPLSLSLPPLLSPLSPSLSTLSPLSPLCPLSPPSFSLNCF